MIFNSTKTKTTDVIKQYTALVTKYPFENYGLCEITRCCSDLYLLIKTVCNTYGMYEGCRKIMRTQNSLWCL